MAEYIDRDAIYTAFANACTDVLERASEIDYIAGFSDELVIEILDNIPTVNVAPIKHGRWDDIPNAYMSVVSKTGAYHGNATTCSVCLEVNPNAFKTNYCPNCGAKMAGGNTNEPV
jgi:hypothetical protein|nr:MAG TPA: PROTEIN/RNA Complex, archaeal, ribosomal, 50S, protein.0A [Caudoviricetes sp.]